MGYRGFPLSPSISFNTLYQAFLHCFNGQDVYYRSGIPQMSAEAVYGGSCKKRVVDAETDSIDPSTIIPGRYARRARQQLSTQTSWTVEAGLGTGH